MDLQERRKLTYLFIAHDLSVVEHISQRVAVMYAGRIVEMAQTTELFSNPRHPYTGALLDAAPEPDPKMKAERILLQGEVADPSNLPPGCHFHPRCQFCTEKCQLEQPELRDLGSDHMVACHFAESIPPPKRKTGASHPRSTS